MYYVGGKCPIDGDYGLLGILVCEQGHMFIMCDECDSIWLEPGLSGEPYISQSIEFPCPYGDHNLFGHWASKEEIAEKGWWPAVVGEYTPPPPPPVCAWRKSQE